MPNRIEAAKRKPRHMPPADYSHCACSRLHMSACSKCSAASVYTASDLNATGSISTTRS